MRLPYARWSDAILTFLRDVCEPYLRLFRRLIPPIGMFDFSPMIAIIRPVHRADDRGQRDLGLTGAVDGDRSECIAERPRRPRSPASVVLAAVVVGLDQLTKHLVRTGIAPGETHKFLPGIQLVHVRNTGVAFGLFSGGGDDRAGVHAGRAGGAARVLRAPPDRPWLWLPTGLLIGGALGNLIDRIAHGAVTDFVKLPLWPAFNVADMAITFGVIALLCVLEGRARRCGDSERAARASRCPTDAAGTRLDRFLAEPLGSRARAQGLIDAERVRVDGRVRPKRHAVKAGELIVVDEREPPAAADGAQADFAIAYEDEYLLVVDKPAGVVVHPARGHRTGTLAQALAGRGGRRRGALARRDRAPARPRHLGAARGRQERRGPPRAQVAAVAPAAAPRVLGAGRRAPAGADGDDRRADRPRPARPGADVDRHRRAARGPDALRDRAAAAARRRCCG